jgi:hypothetical protein
VRLSVSFKRLLVQEKSSDRSPAYPRYRYRSSSAAA